MEDFGAAERTVNGECKWGERSQGKKRKIRTKDNFDAWKHLHGF